MAAVGTSVARYVRTSSVSKLFGELGSWKLWDILQGLIEIIHDGNIDEFERALHCEVVLRHFKARLLEVRVPKDSSPLVITMLNGHFQMFSHILTNFKTNLEQENLAKFERGGEFVCGASPLWIASNLGNIEFVKMLVGYGANIDHTTNFKNSPLSIAAFNGHYEVCEFLIDTGADVDKPDQIGMSPLAVAASKQKKMCVELLIRKGAEVNHKGHNGNTPLHHCIESGNAEIVELLVNAGAMNSPNNMGLTPAILACCFGHEHVMKFLNSKFQIEAKQLYDCYCLLTANEVICNNLSQAEIYMKRSLEIRLTDVRICNILPPPNPIYDNLQEPTNMAELGNILNEKIRMLFISCIYCERILGEAHYITAFCARFTAIYMIITNKSYEKCIDIWHRSLHFQCLLDFHNSAYFNQKIDIIMELVFVTLGVFNMCINGFVPPVYPHFQCWLKVLQMEQESKISYVTVVGCLFCMVALWIWVAEHIQNIEQATNEKSRIGEAVDQLISLMDGHGSDILIDCLQNLPEIVHAVQFSDIDIPLHKVISMFLDRGCCIHCEDEQGNFPLHLAVKLIDRDSKKCVRTLLDYGAHHDVVNFNKETALDIIRHQKCSYSMPILNEVVDELNKAATSQLSLQCLAARAVVRYGIPYLDVLPRNVSKFVSWHQSSIGSTTHFVKDSMVNALNLDSLVVDAG